MATLHDKYRALHQALLAAPEYMSLPDRDRASCRRFLVLVPQLGTDRAAPALEIKTAYQAAIDEARELIAAGRLTADLDGDADPPPANDTERPPAEEPETTVGSEEPPPASESTEAAPAPTGNDAPEDPLALFHALVARGAKFEEYPIHPAADLFPLMEGDERRQLDDDLEADGLLEDIVVHNNQVIDGRNRLRGCLGRGVTPRFVQWQPKDGETVTNYVVKKNLHRRHLNDQQRAMVASKLAEVLAAEGRGRRAENLRQTPDIIDGANLPHREEGRSAERAAQMVNVSPTAVKKAARLRRTGDETLVAAVTAGDISIDAAVQVAEMPKEEQKKVVEAGKVKATAKRVRGEKAARKSKATPAKAKAPKAADPEAAEPLDEQADAPDAPEPDHPVVDEDPLLVEVHEATIEMAAEARQAERMAEVTPTLRLVAKGFRLWAQRLRDGLPLK